MKKQFEKGSSTYTCEICGKTTRDTGIGEKQFNYCRSYYEMQEAENLENDNCE